MTQTSDKVDYRVATRNDGTDILAVLEEVATEIPVSLDTPKSQQIIKIIINQCCDSGNSWVATKADGTVVGFALAKALFGQKQPVSLRYIGVSPGSRGHGISKTLVEKLKANGVPLTASVLHTNKSGMADRLVKMGFAKAESDANETKLQWPPPEAKK